MKRFSYRDRDYPFGQAMLTLRSTMGLSQAGLADFLGVSRRAVSAWEVGSKYPRAEHLKQFITLAVQQKAFPADSAVDEIRELWQLARQKVLLDERWLANLLALPEMATVNIGVMVEQTTNPPSETAPAHMTLQMDSGDALAVLSFYGRAWELNLLTDWVVKERCRVVSILGLGGIGKSALAVSLIQRVAEQFELVIWRSLRDLPSVETLLDDLLQCLAMQATGEMPSSLDQRLSLLLEYMRGTRALLVLDNLESVIDEGKNSGRMRGGYEALERFLRQSAETNHQSCLLITSREKPNILVAQEGNRSPVRALRLARLDLTACEALLADKDVRGTDEEQARLIEIYTGNPLALKIVAQTIFDLYAGAIAPFLAQGEMIFGGVRELLTDQFARLSVLEQRVLLWLSILREPSSFDDLLEVFVTPVSGSQLLEAVDRLYRRSLVEHGQKPGSFALQSVVLEYLTARLIVESLAEIQQGKLSHLIEHGLVQAHAKDYLRKSQERLLIEPLLSLISQSPMELEYQIVTVLNEMRALPYHAQGYAPANLLALLRLHRGHLRGLDLSRLALRSVYLQGVEMQDTTLSKALMQDNVFTHAFSAVLAVDVSKSGDYWAASTSRGDVMLWTATGLTLQRSWRAHSDMIWALKFSSDGRFLATGSWDGVVKVWDITTDTLLWSGNHQDQVNCVVFSPNGRFLASGSTDSTVALWDLESGNQLQTLPHPVAVTGCALDWSPDGKFLVSGDREGTIRLWELPKTGTAECVQTLPGHSIFVDVLAFSPDGRMLASASFDGTVKLWEAVSGQLRLWQTPVGHVARIGRLAWNPDGRTLACGGMDTMVWLFDLEDGSYRAALRGHSSGVTGLAFMSDGSSLLSGGDYSLRLWDISNGRCTRVLEGYSNFLYTIDWSPDSQRLVSGGMDMLVTLWDLSGTAPSRVLHGHDGAVLGIGWSPDGKWVASSEWDNVIRLWNPVSGACLQILQHPDDPDNFFGSLSWSPDGTRLAVGTNRHGVQIFELTARDHYWTESPFPTSTFPVAWSPDGAQLAGGGGDGTVYIWNAGEAMPVTRLSGHHSTITGVAWSPDGTRLASVSRGRVGGELFVWDVQHGEQIPLVAAQPGVIHTVTWGASEDIVISGDSDGMLRWWNIHNGECLLAHQAHQGTVRVLRRSPDEKKLVSCGDDGAITLWDLQTGEHLQTLRRDRPYERLKITGIQGLSETQIAALRNLGAMEDATV